MRMISENPFWRGDRMAAALPFLTGAGVFGALVGGLGWLAQHNERIYYARTVAGAPDLGETYSLLGHAVAMALLATFAVSVASSLALRSARILAAVVLVATAAGPMTVIAAPLDESGYSAPNGPPLTWHVVVAAGLTALLAAWTFWVVRRAEVRQEAPTTGRVHDATIFAGLFTAGFAVAMLMRPDAEETPSYLTIACWTLLSAAAALALWRASGVSSVLISVLPALTLGAMYVAYFRPGGWPGVAGWELWTSPIVFGIPSVAMSLSMPLFVWAARGVRKVRAGSRGSTALSPAITT